MSTNPTSKTTKKRAAPKVEPVAAETSPAAPAPAPVKVAKPRAPRAKKVVAESEPVVVTKYKAIGIEPEPVVEPVVETQPEEEKKKNKRQKLQEKIVGGSADLVTLIEADLNAGKFDEKEKKLVKKYLAGAKKVATDVGKLQKPAKTAKGSQTGGFAKPQPITDAMADFAGWNRGELKSRTDVNTLLCDYIKDHELQTKTNKKFIEPDAKLAELLKYNKDEFGPLDFANMQKFLGHLFIKPAAVTA